MGVSAPVRFSPRIEMKPAAIAASAKMPMWMAKPVSAVAAAATSATIPSSNQAPAPVTTLSMNHTPRRFECRPCGVAQQSAGHGRWTVGSFRVRPELIVPLT
jgi:hypothetical protein